MAVKTNNFHDIHIYVCVLEIQNPFLLTSSLVSIEPSMLGLARLASLGAVMFDKHTVLSGGGPPFGCKRTITASPDNT